MDYFRSGTVAGYDAPGGNILLGLMEKLCKIEGAAPVALVLAQARMNQGLCTPPAVAACELLLYVVEGAVLASVDGEEVNLIANNSVWVHAGSRYAFSTERSVGVTALLIVPLREGNAPPDASSALRACCGDALSLSEEPRLLTSGALDILASLDRLGVDGCFVPIVALTRGKFNRDIILASLLPRYVEDLLELRALIWSFNAHPSAHWWQDRARARAAIEEGIAKLVAC